MLSTRVRWVCVPFPSFCLLQCIFSCQDLTTAPGPTTSTSAGQQEAEAASTNDALELGRSLSVVDEDDADTAEVTTLPSLQRLLERLETQAGRVAANKAVFDQAWGTISTMSYDPLAGILFDGRYRAAEWTARKRATFSVDARRLETPEGTRAAIDDLLDAIDDRWAV